MKLYKNLRGGAPDGPVPKGLATRDERAGLRGEYNILFDDVSYLVDEVPYLEVHQLCIDTFTPQQGVSGRDKNASPYYIPATQHLLAQRMRGAEGGNTRVVLLQLHLSIQALTQGIFQYNNVLGSTSQGITTMYRRSLRSILALKNQHASPGRGNTDVRSTSMTSM